MGSINFNNFKKETYTQAGYTYSDLHLDLVQEPFEMIIGNRIIRGAGKDIKISYDLNAIRNSLVNLFNTAPGERILLPDYGCDLRQFIFEPITETTANRIGRVIKSGIEKWEPRVTIISIAVDGYIEKQEYEITLNISVPFLQKREKLNIAARLNRQGFTIYGGE